MKTKQKLLKDCEYQLAALKNELNYFKKNKSGKDFLIKKTNNRIKLLSDIIDYLNNEKYNALSKSIAHEILNISLIDPNVNAIQFFIELNKPYNNIAFTRININDYV